MLRVGLCGGVAVEVDGRRLPDALLAGRQGRLVLAYLACERRRSVPREELAELLWPDRLPAAWPASLSVVISKLRRLLAEAGLDGPTALASAFGSYRLVLPDDAVVDWEVAAAAVERAELAAADRADEAVTAAREAIQIAELGFLTDDSPWVDTQRERLRDLHARALHAQVKAHLLAGQSARAVMAARDALAVDEVREESYRLLMRALASAGERAEALRVWERCRVMLSEELGVDPAPETEALYLSLLGDAAPAPTASTTPLPSGVVTFLLTDIVDSSALWEGNAAAMAIALERHDRLVAEAVIGQGGTVLKLKLEGDATVSVFPRASGAALAALALQEALAREPWPEGAAIEVRMALHTGEALERDGDYFGLALNRAARLRGLAGAGQILVSQVVAEVVRDQVGVALTSLGEQHLRGLIRGEHVFQLGGRSGSSEESAEAGPLQPPALPAVLAGRGLFVGRRPELDRLAAEWDTALAGTPRVVLIAGEPGVGKSRLAAEWARRAHEQGALVLYGRCDEELGAPYQPFAEAVRALLPLLGSARLRVVRGVEQLAPLAPDLADHVPLAAATGQADPDTDRSLLFDGLARLFGTVSAETPIVIVIDDLHWAAKPTLLLLRHLLRAGDPARMLIVATYRSTDLSRAHPLAGVLADLHRDGAAERLTLGGLASEDVGAYLHAAGHDDTRLVDALSTVTAGNPFFLIEVLRHLEETGGSWDPTTLPQGVREAVDRRLSRLSDDANEALLAGAVAGSQFSLDLIEQVLERDLVDPIDEARRAGLVVEEPGNRFRFYHALVRQSLLAECASVRRVRLHQRIAAALEADPAVGAAHLADLARHYFESAFAGGADKAVDYSRRAGDQAMARVAYEEAADLYAQALQAADIDGSGCGDDDRAELLLARCEALLAAGDPGAAAGVVDQLAHAARRSPRLSGWATCFAGQMAILSHPERLETIVGEVRAAAEAFARLGDNDGEAKAHTVAASCLARLGRVADCEAALDRALVAARLAGNPRGVNAVLGFAPQAALQGPSPVPQASGRCLDVVRVLRITTGSAAVEAAALRCQAVLEAIRGRADAARRMLSSARRSLESLGHTHGLLETDLFSGMVELAAEQPAEAEPLLRRAYEGFAGRGVGADTAQAAALLARAVLLQGRIEDALALSAESERLAGSDLKAAMAWRTVRAEALATQGRTAEALELARSAVALVEPTDTLLNRAEASLTLAVVLRAAGDELAAESEAARAVDAYERKGATALVAAARRMTRSRPKTPNEPTAAPVAHRRIRPNAAWRYVQDSVFDVTGFDEWAAGLSADYVDVDHISHLTTDRGTFITAARRYASEPVTRDRLLLASLGERHALARWTFHYDGAALVDPANRTGAAQFDQLAVHVVDRNGQQCHLERFKPDDLPLAIARLIELHADNELPHERRQERYAIATQFRERRPRWSDDPAVIDHRPLVGYGRLPGPDALDEAMLSVRNFSADARRRIIDVLGLSERLMILVSLAEGHDEEGGPFEIPVIAVSQFGDDGLLDRVDAYSADQIDAALARFDELSSPVPGDELADAATRWGQASREPSLRGEWDAVAASLDDNAVLDDRRAIVGVRALGRDEYLAYARSAYDSGLTHLQHSVMATRGEYLALTRIVAGGPRTEVVSLGVTELAGNGRLLALVVFDSSDVDAAFAELDARYLAGEGAIHADVVRPFLDFMAAYNRGDLALARRLLREADHAEELIAALRSSGERLRVVRVDAAGAVFLCEADGGTRFAVRCHTAESKITALELLPSDHSAPRAPRRRVRPNLATAFQELAWRAFEAGDHEAWAQAYSDDFVDVDHSSHVTIDRATFVRSAGRYQGSLARGQSAVTPLASLGERHALYRASFQYENAPLVDPDNRTGDASFDVVMVMRTDAAGRACLGERFRSEDLHLAVARLIELHADDELPPERRAGQYVAASIWRDSRYGYSVDAVRVDHRPGGLWTQHGPDAIERAHAGMMALSADLQWHRSDLLALTERLVLSEVVADGHNEEGGPVQFRVLALAEIGDDGLARRVELYDPSQLDDAFARFDALVAQASRVVLSNAATRLEARYIEAIRTGDMGLVASMTAEDGVLDDRRAMIRMRLEGRDERLANTRSMIESHVSRLEVADLAIRGERFALHRLSAGGPLTSLNALLVNEVTNEGQIAGGVVFDADRLDEALAELDEWYLAAEGRPYVDTLRPALEFVRASQRIVRVEAVQHGGAVFLCQDPSTDALSYVAYAVEDGAIGRLESFPLDRRDAALAQLKVFTESSPSRRRRVRPNSATRLAAAKVLDVGDLEAFAAHLSDDLVDVDHVSRVTTGRDELLRMARTYAAEPGTIKLELLATLGDRHALHRTTTRWEGAAIVEAGNRTGAADIVLLTVTRTDGAGRLTRIERFGAGDLHLAVACLIELHADDELPPERRGSRYISAGSWRDREARYSDDAVQVDHRAAGLWSLDGPDALKVAQAAMMGLSTDLQWRHTDILALTERLAVFEVVAEGHNDEGGPVHFRVIALGELGDDGLTRRNELYATEQLDDALARFDELATPAGFLPRNMAARARDRETDALVRGDLAAYLACFTDDVGYEEPRYRLSLRGIKAVEDNARHVVSIGGVSDLGAELMATRGDRLSLHRSRWQANVAGSGPIESSSIELTETNGEGLITHFILYSVDEIDAAYIELDRRYAEGEGAPFAVALAAMAANSAAYNERDWGRLRSTLADDAVWVDHRPVGWGTVEGDGILAMSRTLVDLAADNRSYTPMLFRLTDRGWVGTYEATGTDDASGGQFAREAVYMGILEAGRIQRLEFFSVDDVESALRRFDELTSPVELDDIPPPNAAARAWRRSSDAFRRGDHAAQEAALAPGTVYDDRRAVVGGYALRGAAALESVRVANPVSDVADHLLATRGERLSLHDVMFRGNDAVSGGPFEIGTIMLTEIDAEGLISSTVLFDSDDLDGAFEELEARFAAGEAGPFDWAAAVNLNAAYNRRDWSTYEALLADDVTLVDHRPAGFGTFDRAQLLDAMRTLFDLVPDAKVRVLAVPAIAAGGYVTLYERTGHDATGAQVMWREAAVTLTDHGLVQRYEPFPVDELDAAVARFEELVRPVS